MPRFVTQNIAKVLSHVAMKTERNRAQVNTKLFHPLLDMLHENKDTPVVERKRKITALVPSQLYCLEMGCGLRFLKKEETESLLLYKK